MVVLCLEMLVMVNGEYDFDLSFYFIPCKFLCKECKRKLYLDVGVARALHIVMELAFGSYHKRSWYPGAFCNFW